MLVRNTNLVAQYKTVSNRVLKTKFPDHVASLEEEEALAQNRLDIGDAWESDKDDAVKAENGQQDREAPTSTSSMRILADAETWKQESHED